MTTTVTMLAPVAGQNYVCQSGNSYTSDVNALIHSVAIVDVLNLVADGLVALTTGGKNNLTATTNPGSTDDVNDGYVIGSVWFNKSTGTLYLATAVTAAAAVWATINAASVPGLAWLTGQFYGLPSGATQAAVLTVAGDLYATPVFIPNAVNLDSVSYSVTTGQTGGKVRGALFYDNGAGYPGAIVPDTDTGDLDATGTAVVGSSSVDVDLPAGWYWIGTIATATTTKPSVIGTTATYANGYNALLGSDTAADALATASKVSTGIVKTSQTYPAVDMATSFPTFPAGAALQINVTTPIAALGV